jgi:hypothetical protein
VPAELHGLAEAGAAGRKAVEEISDSDEQEFESKHLKDAKKKRRRTFQTAPSEAKDHIISNGITWDPKPRNRLRNYRTHDLRALRSCCAFEKSCALTRREKEALREVYHILSFRWVCKLARIRLSGATGGALE